ncbi:hypothetical protein P153DRAFT_396847 [Dothidotthia symphoricarpi CBS 119687]|uniref:NAD(P)-binding domain-containing protein n=1 Tax=Dothidotthia symphoricarpi CBS 119687 TaxID=1392245 RepID=A0A6A6ACU1_9PLEO|nr:uncharacterized protein P153DRAFT_396847 [Dothidotthia symphoricarpi CBS 119687]KAF2129590.1 hypothetical protein P153DRAFT_396847 [Dothidotthia symphoricarpi CBS 119687]
MAHNILLVGGHGKVSQLLTPLLLARSWNVTSMIRTAEQKDTIEKLGKGQPGKLSVLVSSAADVKSEADAKKILEQVDPDWVIWAAGAGGKGGESNTLAVDRDAAIAFTKASIHTPSVKKFLTVSYLASRRNRPSWWTDSDWENAQKTNTEVLPTYYKAKIAADEVLTVLSRERLEEETKSAPPSDGVDERFCGISLRPGTLTDGEAGGVTAGRIGVGGKTTRATTAEAIVAALATEGARGWFDVIDGDENLKDAIIRLSQESQDTADDEDFEKMKENVASL